jgi:hypothetical protein
MQTLCSPHKAFISPADNGIFEEKAALKLIFVPGSGAYPWFTWLSKHKVIGELKEVIE